MRSRAKDFLVSLREVLAPARCISCLEEGSWHCSACRQRFRTRDLACIVCGETSPQGLTCADCRGESSLHGVISVGSYQDQSLRRAISWLKFKGVRDVAEPLSSLLVHRLSAIAPLPQLAERAILVPIPLHPRRQRTRGFNQSEDIAKIIHAQTKIPVQSILTRPKATFTQSNLPHHLRRKNAKSAFQLADSISLHSSTQLIILIDDVTTSGATLSAAGEALTPLGKQIWGATIARG